MNSHAKSIDSVLEVYISNSFHVTRRYILAAGVEKIADEMNLSPYN